MIDIRALCIADLDAVAGLCAALWPDSPAAEHRQELAAKLVSGVSGPYPCAVFVAHAGEAVVGFVEAGMRSHADGCDDRKPVGYLEGWYVVESWRKGGIGRALVAAAEGWARERGCDEMASDTWIDNESSQDAHAALGYEVVDRCITYRKTLVKDQ
jgi:aminoglycoside 6'-N-acetyltransferase I